MNERIRELIKSCGIIPEDEHYEVAELIVKECIDQARLEEDRFYGLAENDLALTMEHFQKVLKNHFGIE